MSNESLRTNKEIVEHVEKLLHAAYGEQAEFNEAFDAGEMVEFASVQPGGGPYHFKPSEVLFWVDRSAYNDEAKAWADNHIVDLHKDALDHLKDSDQEVVIKDLVDAISRRRVAPFIGAGLSAPDFPLWSAALLDIADRINSVDRDRIEAMINGGDFLGAAQELWSKDDTQVKNYIRNRFARAKIPRDGMGGAIRLLPEICDGCVITTNFDAVIEDILKGDVLEAYMHGMQKGNKFVARLIRGDRCLLKLHGDAEDHDTYIFTREQYANGYGDPLDFSKHLPRALRQIFVSHSLLFLGCSLEEDQTMSLFRQVMNDGQFDVPDHFAILPAPEDPVAKGQKENRLLELKIRPIWYPAGQHEMVEMILRLTIDVSRKCLQI